MDMNAWNGFKGENVRWPGIRFMQIWSMMTGAHHGSTNPTASAFLPVTLIEKWAAEPNVILEQSMSTVNLIVAIYLTYYVITSVLVEVHLENVIATRWRKVTNIIYVCEITAHINTINQQQHDCCVYASHRVTITLRTDFVILQLCWWLFTSTKHCSWNVV